MLQNNYEGDVLFVQFDYGAAKAYMYMYMYEQKD